MRVLCDVDGVLADFVGGVTRAAQALGSKGHRDWPVWDIWPNFEPDLHRNIEAAICAPDFALELESFDGAIEAARRIGECHELVFVTTPWHSPTWVYDRARWLRRYFEHPIVFTWNKELVSGDVLIEDNPKACEIETYPVLLVHRSYNDGAFASLQDVADTICP